MERLAFYLLLAVLLICGCVLTALTREAAFFGGALVVVALVLFWDTLIGG